jgi:hypothetical protein
MPAVSLEFRGPIACLSIDHAQRRNAFTRSMWRSIPALMEQISNRASARVVCLQSAVPGAFAAGADISEFEQIYGHPQVALEATLEIQRAIDAHGLPWTAIRFGPRSGQWYGPAPSTSTEALALAVANIDLTRLFRIWLANRGIWEALPGAGPNVPIPATSEDIRQYLTAYDELLDALAT